MIPGTTKVTRYIGKRTTGRYVYKSKTHGWIWQCDLHDDYEPPPWQWGEDFASMPDAFRACYAHAIEACRSIRPKEEA